MSKSLIKSAAHFVVVCDGFGQSGHIVFADGLTAEEVDSRCAALAQVDYYHREGNISKEEIPELIRQIETSPLRCHSSEVEFLIDVSYEDPSETTSWDDDLSIKHLN
ncbi:hypothetical protein CL629_02730 [bacterium]|nr:hypothetical protein [bacterium]